MTTFLKLSVFGWIVGMLLVRAVLGEDKPKAVCGNGKIEVGETCDDGNTLDGDSCPANCRIDECKEVAGTPKRFSIFLDGPAGADVGGVNVFIRYPESDIGIPSGGSDEVVRRYVTDLPDDALGVPNDEDYGLREVIASTRPLSIGKLFTVGFQACEGAKRQPSAKDLSCRVDDAADSKGNKVMGLSCSVHDG